MNIVIAIGMSSSIIIQADFFFFHLLTPGIGIGLIGIQLLVFRFILFG
jgi:hypothetical protein